MSRLKQTILILAAAAALLLPACSPSDDVTLPAPAAECITVTTPPKPAFSGDEAQTRFNQEIGRWEIGDVAGGYFYTKSSDGTKSLNDCILTCVAVNTDGSAVWKINDFPTDAVEIAMDDYGFEFHSPDRYRITADYIRIDNYDSEENYASIANITFKFPITDLEHHFSRFRLTGLQKGDYVIIDDAVFEYPYEPTGCEAINNIRFIAKDDEDTYIYMNTTSVNSIPITVARRGVTLSKKLNMNSGEGKAYSIDISTFKAFDGENPQDVTWIHNATELLSFSEDVNSSMDYAGKTVRLACDIDWHENTNFPVIGDNDRPFKGIFDGNGYSIRNLDIKGYDVAALFYKIGETATVKNLTLENIKVEGSKKAYGFVVENYGTIDHCTVTGGTVSAKDNFSDAVGFMKQNEGTVTYCTVNKLSMIAMTTIGFTDTNSGTMERCGVTGTTTLSGMSPLGFINYNTNNHYIIGCYSDAKKADGGIYQFAFMDNNGIAHCRNGNEKVNNSSWSNDTGWYRTDTPDGVLKLFWEE